MVTPFSYTRVFSEEMPKDKDSLFMKLIKQLEKIYPDYRFNLRTNEINKRFVYELDIHLVVNPKEQNEFNQNKNEAYKIFYSCFNNEQSNRGLSRFHFMFNCYSPYINIDFLTDLAQDMISCIQIMSYIYFTMQ